MIFITVFQATYPSAYWRRKEKHHVILFHQWRFRWYDRRSDFHRLCGNRIYYQGERWILQKPLLPAHGPIPWVAGIYHPRIPGVGVCGPDAVVHQKRVYKKEVTTKRGYIVVCNRSVAEHSMLHKFDYLLTII